MSGLMPGIGKGTHAFHPSEQTHGASSTILTMIHESTSGNETESSTTTAALPSPIIQPSTNPVSPTTHLQHCTTPSVTNELPPSSPQSATSSNNHMPPPSSLRQVPHTSRLVSSSSTSKRKFSALDASVLAQSSNASGKKQCSAVPGAVALNGIKESLDMFNKTIEHSLVQPQEHAHADTSPEHHAKAMSHLQELETHLDNAHIIAMIDLFKSDTSEADTYMSLQHEALCKRWLQKQLVDHCGFPSDDDMTV